MKLAKEFRRMAGLGLALGMFFNAGSGLHISKGSAAATRKDQSLVRPSDHAPEPGGKLAFASERDGNYEIYSMEAGGGGLTRLTNHPAADREPVWSPDGTMIAFVSDRDGNAEIYVLNTTITADVFNSPTRLTTNPGDDHSPAWSPDDSKIAFVSSRAGNDEIFVMNASGGGQTNLTNRPEGDDFDPSWSPDGSKLAFASTRDGNEEIYTMEATGAAQSNISNNAADERHPSWGGGNRIAFQSTRDGNEEIYIMNAADGSAQTRLTQNAAFDVEPWLSNDGTRIAFSSTRDDNFEIYTMNSNGSGLKRLTSNSEENDFEVALQLQPPPAPQTSGAVLQFDGSTKFVTEGTPTVTVNVLRSGNNIGSSVVDYAVLSGTASDRADFATTAGTLRFGEGEMIKSITISIIDDGFAETDETATLTLSNPTGATLGTFTTATLIINDNDTTAAATNPMDVPETFVRQQYLDFLNREPDSQGFNSWVNLLRSCQTGNASCDRVEVSAAFFRSVEFQLKGYFVIRMYLASFGRLPTYREFVRDTQRINGATSQEVFANLTAYTNEFVARPEFKAIYDALSNAAYVDKILQTARLTLPNRDQLVNDLNAGTKTRAEVLRTIVESVFYFAKEYNRGFVASQYYGYLRREPDTEGFNNWLNYLNSHPNDYRTMVHGFVNSIEYRARFGTP